MFSLLLLECYYFLLWCIKMHYSDVLRCRYSGKFARAVLYTPLWSLMNQFIYRQPKESPHVVACAFWSKTTNAFWLTQQEGNFFSSKLNLFWLAVGFGTFTSLTHCLNQLFQSYYLDSNNLCILAQTLHILPYYCLGPNQQVLNECRENLTPQIRSLPCPLPSHAFSGALQECFSELGSSHSVMLQAGKQF